MNWQFHPEALVEYLEAVAWYESRRAGLGAALSRETDALIQSTCDAPERFPAVDSTTLRRAYLEHFPCHVLFRVANDQLEVQAVATTGGARFTGRTGFSSARAECFIDPRIASRRGKKSLTIPELM